MKKLILILLLFLPFKVFSTTYYIATDGNDSNPGDIDHPWLTWEKINGNVVAGDIVYIRGGTYRSTYNNSATTHVLFSDLTGTSSDTIKIWAYPGESPILNLDNITVTSGYCFGLNVSYCSYIHIKGLRVTGLRQPSTGAPVWGMLFDNLNHAVIENCVVDNTMYGFTWGDGADILVKNCDAHHLADPYSEYPYGGSNGFNITGGSRTTNIIFEGCRAWFVSDDGFDFFEADDGIITLNACWAFWNGYDEDFNHLGDGNGFKLGPNYTNKNTTHLKTITNCVAVGNYFCGFTQNSLAYSCIMWLYNNVAYDNGEWGFDFNIVDVANVATNNIAYSNSVGEATFSESAVDTYNSWNGGVATITAADFVSVDTSTLNNARQANGDLPVLTFLHLAGSSDAVAAGVAIGGLTLDGDGETWDDPPSIGAWEYQYETPQVSLGMSHGKHLFINGKRAVIY